MDRVYIDIYGKYGPFYVRVKEDSGVAVGLFVHLSLVGTQC